MKEILKALREELTLPDLEGNLRTGAYISLYGENDIILARTGSNHTEGHITLNYKGLVFISPSRNGDVSVLFSSLKYIENTFNLRQVGRREWLKDVSELGCSFTTQKVFAGVYIYEHAISIVSEIKERYNCDFELEIYNQIR